MPPTRQNPTVESLSFSPALAATGTYPFVKLEEAKRRLAAHGVELIDFGKGDPREPTDPIIRRALAENLAEISTYPLAEGIPELRVAVAEWCKRRFGTELDPDTEVVPTYGSKEAIFLLAQLVVDRDADKRLVVTTEPGYPVPERGAAFAGADILQLPLLEQNVFLPDLEAVEPETWERAAIVWLNYPNNPTGAVAALARKGIRVVGSTATMFLWLEVPAGESSEEFASRLLAHGLIVSPGTFFGPAGEGYWRLALVPTVDECRRAAEILENVL